MGQAGRCRFCDGRIIRRRYETDALFAARTYCDQPACLIRGKQEHLEPLYAKDHPDALERHRAAFLTRALFVSRWGMEPLDAFDAYGREAITDWGYLYEQVKDGKAVAVRVSVEVYGTTGEALFATEEWKHSLYGGAQTSAAVDMATAASCAAERVLIERLYGEGDGHGRTDGLDRQRQPA
jgi:hypothetical protein